MESHLFNPHDYLNSAIRELMNQIGKCYRAAQQLTDELLVSLHALFPLHSVAALDLVDHKSVALVSSPSDRRIYSCLGSSGTPYLISYTGSFCTCPAYKRNLSEENMWCKHLLAVQLSLATGIIQSRSVTEEVIMSMLQDMVLD